MSYFGDIRIGRMPLGEVEIAKAYLGDTLVFSSEDPVPRLPYGYTEVKSITNSTNAIVDTGINGASTWKFTAQAAQNPSTGILVGHSSASGSWFGSISTGAWGAGSASGAFVALSSTSKSKIEASFDSSGVQGTVANLPFARQVQNEMSDNFLLFGDLLGNYPFRGTIFGDVVAMVSGNEVFRGVCCKNSNNVAGLYDLISDSFITSENSTALIAGAEI